MTMTRNRLGISFTLTLVVVGVVLLMTALTVIVLGGGSIADFFQQSSEGSLDAAVSQACAQKAQQINNNYCSWYVDTGGEGTNCDDVRRNPSTNYERLAENVPCDWDDKGGSGNPLADVLESTSGDGGDGEDGEDGEDGGSYAPIVTVQGNDYNCLEEGEMTTTCPA